MTKDTISLTLHSTDGNVVTSLQSRPRMGYGETAEEATYTELYYTWTIGDSDGAASGNAAASLAGAYREGGEPASDDEIVAGLARVHAIACTIDKVRHYSADGLAAVVREAVREESAARFGARQGERDAASVLRAEVDVGQMDVIYHTVQTEETRTAYGHIGEHHRRACCHLTCEQIISIGRAIGVKECA